ncbi:Uncharacterized protein SCF082_LOCUS50893 [Durusdinium trenchii]|uniref:Endonuclease/exonuclease/phosphatase domain-containing protein n=1 Tax=Durusdinium trenchii TaxID=1381693 RepID=A0ABP0SB03_9DINO
MLALMQRTLAVLALATLLLPSIAAAQEIGECITLTPRRPGLGIPLHTQAGVNSWEGERVPVDSIVTVVQTHDSGWLRVRFDALEGWISTRYIGDVVPCLTTTGLIDTGSSEQVCRIATWNIEWFKDGKSRGFPELIGDEALPARTSDDFGFIAKAIITMEVELLLLQEIHGDDIEVEGEWVAHSPELERLISILNNQSGATSWDYRIGTTGRDQRLAFLWDTRTVGLEWWCEAALPSDRVNGKELFDRQPIVGMFSCFKDGLEMNDFIAVNLHLASGQRNAKNHDMAMQRVLEWIELERGQDNCIPSDELDIVIGGDLNASRFDTWDEDFWDTMESGSWDVLADDTTYPGTRLRADPPGSLVSTIDYLIVSKGTGALQGDEVTMTHGHVRHDLLALPSISNSALTFRLRASDHMPVTVDVRITDDTD